VLEAAAIGRPRGGTVLLVSADRSWLASATAFLAAATRTLSTAETAQEAIDAAMRQPPDVAVVAPPLATGSPLALVTQLAALREHVDIGIVYVADREREFAEHSRLVRAGANDWFPRGIPASEVASRIAALADEIRGAMDGRAIVRGPLTLDRASRLVVVSGSEVSVTDREYAILESLAVAAGRVLSVEELTATIGVRRGPNSARSIADHVISLQSKLGVARGLLEVSRRHGYRLRFVAPA
jgi:two-component system KDP operon response regulator KdpE